MRSTLTAYNPDTQFMDQHATIDTTAYGQHQQKNGALAFAAIRQLAASSMIDAERVNDAKLAIEQTNIPGRLQRIQLGEATIWLDAAHNAHAVKALLPTLPSLAEPLTSILIFTREERDLSDSLHLLRPYALRLAGKGAHGLDARYSSVADALEGELNIYPDGNFLVLGSFSSVAAALDWLEVDC